ncbi:phosphotransferase family protein [Xylona heveae TC161]|uniref:Phosphotransferase family protein n=1 Tax=Xylona heveae (strain CBS 132557 / TC161) TaxID=1328760 RepID=A0A165GS72_XYLHT|nr:phosphotransferase family protein [Xylona heveae TC161]KZF22528.1 phosphotransferase family protein [Xylona heveae TC161]
MNTRYTSSWYTGTNLFEYTSGRFLFNEEFRRAERRIQFDVNALAAVICRATDRHISELASIQKLAEGGFNRVLQATFNDGYEVLARLPYHHTVPKHHVIASEAATLGFLHSCGIPVPKVIGYSPVNTNTVGTEYLLYEKVDGTPLSNQWFTMDNKTRTKIMRQIVRLEKQFMSISFPASGSIYYRRDLEPSDICVSLPEPQSTLKAEMVIGPTTQSQWWNQERASLDVDRGPWKTFLGCFEAPAKREIAFCQRFGRPRLHVERYLREMHDFKKQYPTVHAQLLSEYMQLAPYLQIPSGHRFSRPVLRHPDLSPSNILVNSSCEIVGIIDWQYAVALPLCLCAGIPNHFQNWGDPLSETLAKPEVNLPEDFDDLGQDEQEAVKETMRRRLVHFYYAALTLKHMPDHFDALREENSMLRAQLYDRARKPWEGDSLSLKYAIVQACQNWPMRLEHAPSTSESVDDCPVKYSEEDIRECTNQHDEEQERLEELSEMREYIGIDSLGWVPDDEQYDRSRAIVQTVKAGLLEYSNTEMERRAVQEHFPFDDHDDV